MDDKKCYFCNDGEKFIGDTIVSIKDQLENPIVLTGNRICDLCGEILCKEAVNKMMGPLGGYKI